MSLQDPDHYKNERNADWRLTLRKTINQKDRTKIERVIMPVQGREIRIKNNNEVNKGITADQAVNEARRCLDCVVPECVSGCPIGINIPKFIKYIEKGEFRQSLHVLKDSNTLPSVCGRVCPQEIQCEAKCFYVNKLGKPAVAIGYLERFVADFERESGLIDDIQEIRHNNIKVAVIGSGPAGLAAAGDLAKQGYSVTVFEALHEIGGVLKYGIPEFRLPKRIVEYEIDSLRRSGVEFTKNFVIGKTADFNDLRASGYKAFFIASGAGLPRFMNIPGENYIGILSSNEYLTRVNLMNAANPEYDTPVHFSKNVAVIGGGNTAMDSVRTAKRNGAERAMIIYRRSIKDIPARKEELHHAIEEGIEFKCLENPVEYRADKNGRVRQMVLQKMTEGDPDESGRRKPVPVMGSEYVVDIDQVIVSIGVSPNPLISREMPELEVNKIGTFRINPETMQTNIPDIFAGGDIVRGGATVILAMGDGRKAAKNINEYLSSL